MAEVLEVEKREQVGSSATQRLRRNGRIPAVLYGHGEGNEHLSVQASQVKTLLRNHSKTVELAGDLKETALVSQVQWDPLGIEVLHLDLIRVNLKELVQVTVAVHRQGDAVGLRQGGLMVDNAHEVEVQCSAGQIPESITLDVADLGVGEQKTAADLDLPEGVTLVTPSDTVIAHVEAPKGAAAGASGDSDADGDSKEEEG